MTDLEATRKCLYFGYLMLSGFSTKSIFMSDEELDYTAMAETKQMFDNFADGTHPAPWIYVWSRAKGSGKSMLAARSAIRYADRLRRRYVLPSHDGLDLARIRFVCVPDMLVKVRDTMTARSLLSEDDILQPLKDAELLVLDDIGAEKPSDFSARVLADLVSARNAHPERRTIITANMGLNALASHFSVSAEAREQAERIVDRICEHAHVIEVPDLNFRAKSTLDMWWRNVAEYSDRLAKCSPVLASLRAEIGLE